MYVLVAYRRHRIEEHKRKEEAIRDYYQYHELLDPSRMDT